MSNTLTGDFDVVAQFAIPAANRVLAAMHRTGRFPHSLSMRVDDTRRPGLDDAHPSTVGAVDTFGDPVTNHQRIGRPMAVAGLSASANAAYLGLDPVARESSQPA